MTLISLIISYFAPGLPYRHRFYSFDFVVWLCILPICSVGTTVLAIWVVLWISGSWYAEQSWIDRTGRAVGIYWVASGVLLESALLAGVA